MWLQVAKKMEDAKAQMEYHVSVGQDAMAHIYLPPSMLDVGTLLTVMLPINIRPMVNLISVESLRSLEREARKDSVVEMPSGARTKHSFDHSIECFEKWAVDVVGVKIKLMSKATFMPQLSHMPQLTYGSTSGGMPFGSNPYGGNALVGNAYGGHGSQYQKRRKLVHKVDKPCNQWSMKGSCSYGSECRFRHVGGDSNAAPAAAM
ncbi:TPA: hypothetical protein ACH3X1_009232 [Trebouxia sp. C0004]